MDSAIGRSEVAEDVLDPRPARHFQLTLDRAATLAEGDALPPFWHYLYFNPQLRASELGPDGHERLGRFIPDFGLPRRIWAGGKVEIARPLRLGERVVKTSTITGIDDKTGRSGRLCFVTLEHVFAVDGTRCVTETQNVVYRNPPAPDAPAPSGKPAPEGCDFSRVVHPDPVMLFRYSALIFYGHRIHYDADYTRGVEGYPGLLVHGPLTATMLVDLGLAEAEGRNLRSISIRAMAPLFVGAPVRLEGRHLPGGGMALWARTPQGTVAMEVGLGFAGTGGT